MSGPIAIEYVLVSALLDAAWGAYQASQQRRAEELAREQAAADRRAQARRAAAQQREEERRERSRAKARAEEAAQLLAQARTHERRLERSHALAAAARERFPELELALPAAPAAPSDHNDPDAVRRYIESIRRSAAAVEAAVRARGDRAASNQGMQALLAAIETTVESEPRTAAEVLALYAAQAKALAAPQAGKSEDRRAAAERILGRLAGVEAGELPPELDALMRKLIEADSDARAEMLLLELRAQVQSLNEARARESEAAAENRRREMAGVLVAEVLSDLGYEVEPIAETLFVSGGVAHFQRAEWGDYYIRMRVDPATRNVNFNMVRTSAANAPPDAAQRKRDEEMEARWCAGIPKLLAELAARGIDTRKLRELDAGAVPVQLVHPNSVDAVLRDKAEAPLATAAPKSRARPLE